MYKLNDAFDDLVTTMNLKYSKTTPSVIFMIVPDEKICLDLINLIDTKIDKYPEFNSMDIDITSQIYRSCKINALIEKSMSDRNHITIVVVPSVHKDYIDHYILKEIKNKYPILLTSGAKRYDDRSFKCMLTVTDPSGKTIECENVIEASDTFFTLCYQMDLPKL